MTPLFLSRARLKRDVPAAALARLLVPDDAAARVDASHRLIWALFSDSAERTRDFLWREEEPGKFMLLSARPPTDPHGLFVLESKAFEPALSPGDRLSFTLRANPAIARSEGPGKRGKRHDVVMDLLHAIPPGERADSRPGAVMQAGRAWIARQGIAHGFEARGDEALDGYDRIVIARGPGKSPAVFGSLDISGVLTVRDPERLLTAIAAGFGRARAHGRGLMLIRRAP